MSERGVDEQVREGQLNLHSDLEDSGVIGVGIPCVLCTIARKNEEMYRDTMAPQHPEASCPPGRVHLVVLDGRHASHI